jgi:hapalindole-type alkaloid chlorinase
LIAVSEDVVRRVQWREASLGEADAGANAIEELYGDRLDVLALRGALPQAPVLAAAQRLDLEAQGGEWARPNEPMPIEDIQILGTDTPATPTYKAPRGPSLEAYLASAARHRGAADRALGAGLDWAAAIPALLGRLAGGRPVELARARDGTPFAPYTVRRLTAGKQIGVHHDFHYGLALYRELADSLDTRTLVSYVVTLRRPESGGELRVYGVTPTTPDAPKMANGYQWDLAAIEARYDAVSLQFDAGDLFLLASGRCLHRVGRVQGERARITLGGFLALDRAGERVLYWS